MKKNPSWGDVILAFVLVVVSFLAIVIFLVFPYVKGRITGALNQTASVSEETSVTVSEEIPEVSVETSTEPSTEVSEPVHVDPPQIDIPEDVQKIVWEKVEHPDITDCDIVFIGDSIFATGCYDEYSSTVSDVVRDLSGARVYNLAIPGMCAGEGTNTKVISQQEAVKRFLNLEQIEEGTDIDLFNSELGRLANDDHSGRQLVVIMDCTINDYFMHTELTGNAYDENTYFGAITNCINWIMADNPYAIVCYVRTHSILHGTNGYDFNNVGATYNMYKEIAIDACNYEGAFSITCDGENGINYDNSREYTEDGTHLNYEGRVIEGEIIKDFLVEVLPYY